MAGAAAVEARLSEPSAERLLTFLDLLLAWNRKVNLTAITDREQAIEAHLVDSLAVAPSLGEAQSALDFGAGGGLPGIPLAIALPGCRFTLVDSVAKKVGFLKAAIAQLGLDNARASHARAQGHPEQEGIAPAEAAVCRAFLAPEAWLALAPAYLVPHGRVLAMLGAQTAIPATPAGLEPPSVRAYRLPRSGAVRRVATWIKGP